MAHCLSQLQDCCSLRAILNTDLNPEQPKSTSVLTTPQRSSVMHSHTFTTLRHRVRSLILISSLTDAVVPNAGWESISRAVKELIGNTITNWDASFRSSQEPSEDTFGLVSTTYMKAHPGLASLIACNICSSSRQRALNPDSGWLQRHMAACNTQEHIFPTSRSSLLHRSKEYHNLLVLSVLFSALLKNCHLNGHAEIPWEYFTETEFWES